MQVIWYTKYDVNVFFLASRSTCYVLLCVLSRNRLRRGTTSPCKRKFCHRFVSLRYENDRQTGQYHPIRF